MEACISPPGELTIIQFFSMDKDMLYFCTKLAATNECDAPELNNTIIIDNDHINDNVGSYLSIFHGHVIHTSTHLILPCGSSCVGAVVGSLVHTLNCTWVRLLQWTPISKMPILFIVETGSPCCGTLSNVVSLWW
jgi:hypothetical protein